MFMTMNGKVKMAIAKTTVGRLYRALTSPGSRAPASSGVAGPPGSRMKPQPEGDVQGAEHREDHERAHERPVADLAHQDVGERDPEDEVDEHRQDGQLRW